MSELEALNTEQDEAAEAAFAAKTAVLAGNVSQVHKTDPFDGFCLLFILRFVGLFGSWCAILVGRGDEGRVLSI